MNQLSLLFFLTLLLLTAPITATNDYNDKIRFSIDATSVTSTSKQVLQDITNSAAAFFQSFLKVSTMKANAITESPYSCSNCDILIGIKNTAKASPDTILTPTVKTIFESSTSRLIEIDFNGLADSPTALSTYAFHRLVRLTIHCIMKSIAFGPTFQESSGFPSTDYKNLVAAFKGKFSTCSSNIKNLPVIKDTDDFYVWDAAYVNQDLMTVNPYKDDMVWSVFDTAILKDMPWFFSVSDTATESLTVSTVCPSTCAVNNNIFCPSSSTDLACNESLTAKSTCTALDPAASSVLSCRVYRPITNGNCYDLALNDSLASTIQQTGTEEVRGYQSKCFASDIQLVSVTTYAQPLRCYKYSCDSSYTITIYLDVTSTIPSIDTVTCSVALQGSSIVFKNYKYYSSTGLKCPANNKALCVTRPKQCKNFCSNKGACVGGSCVCIAGYYGDDCSCKNYQEDGVCVNACSKKKTGDTTTHVCSLMCNADQYYSTTSKSCYQCNSNCATCWGTNTTCDSCKTGYQLGSNLTCKTTNLPSCSSTQYYDSGTASCQKCDSNCLTCFDSSKFCLTCDTGYYLASGVCKACTIGCVSCSAIDLCLKCSTTTYLSMTLNECLTSIPSGQYGYNNTCVTACPSGYFADSNSLCQPCDSTCLTCTTSAKNCLSCDYYMKFAPNTCTPLCDDKQVYVKDKQVPGNWSFKCAPCSAAKKCMTCLNTAENCTSCADSYSYLNGTCLYSCPTAYYSDNSVCMKCDSSCATCAKSATQCLTCATGLYLEDSTNCVSTCKSTNTANADTMTCTVKTTTTVTETSGEILKGMDILFVVIVMVIGMFW